LHRISDANPTNEFTLKAGLDHWAGPVALSDGTQLNPQGQVGPATCPLPPVFDVRNLSRMADLKDPKWIWFKGWLFLALGFAAATLVFLESPSWRNALYLGVTIWAFCRFYYFAFYVIERYVDSTHRFSGLGAFAAYVWRKKRQK